MELKQLAGNPRIRQMLENRREDLPHACIISGPVGSGRHTLSGLLCAAMVCQAESRDRRPCGVCGACKKAFSGIHPDVNVITGPDEGKPITVQQVRDMRNDAYIRPNEGRRKVYVLEHAGDMRPDAQNAMLKLLEEGPEYAAFLLLCENPGSILQTIRSRSVEWKLAPAGNGGAKREEAQQLCLLLSERRNAEITAFCTDLENSKVSREELQSILSDARDLLAAALSASYGAETGDSIAPQLAREMGRRRIAAAIEVLQRFIRECGYNIGVGHLTGALAVALTQ